MAGNVNVRKTPRNQTPWWKSSGQTIETLVDTIKGLNRKLLPEIDPLYTRNAALLACLSTNKISDTLPEQYDEFETHIEMFKIWEGPEDLDPQSERYWYIDGGNRKKGGRAQLLQTIKTLKFLCKPESLRQETTVEMICKAHEILTNGAMEEDNCPFKQGIRKVDVYSGGGHIYEPHENVKLSLQTFVRQLNIFGLQLGQDVPSLSEKQDPDKEAHQLLAGLELCVFSYRYLVSTIHPFRNGNGRLGRLLMARIMMQHGLKYPISLLDGSNKNKRHFDISVSAYNNDKGNEWLLYYLAECLCSSLNNINDNITARSVAEKLEDASLEEKRSLSPVKMAR